MIFSGEKEVQILSNSNLLGGGPEREKLGALGSRWREKEREGTK